MTHNPTRQCQIQALPLATLYVWLLAGHPIDVALRPQTEPAPECSRPFDNLETVPVLPRAPKLQVAKPRVAAWLADIVNE